MASRKSPRVTVVTMLLRWRVQPGTAPSLPAISSSVSSSMPPDYHTPASEAGLPARGGRGIGGPCARAGVVTAGPASTDRLTFAYRKVLPGPWSADDGPATAAHAAHRRARAPRRLADRFRRLADAAALRQRDRRAKRGADGRRALRPLAHGRTRGDRPRCWGSAGLRAGRAAVGAGARPRPVHDDLRTGRRDPRRPDRLPAFRGRVPGRCQRR